MIKRVADIWESPAGPSILRLVPRFCRQSSLGFLSLVDFFFHSLPSRSFGRGLLSLALALDDLSLSPVRETFPVTYLFDFRGVGALAGPQDYLPSAEEAFTSVCVL